MFQKAHIKVVAAHAISIIMQAFIIFLAAATTSCGSDKTGKNGASASVRPTLTVSIPPLEYFARAIGGDSISVTTLLPAGADPETFEPRTATMRELGASGAIAVSGNLPFEEALMENIRANNPDLKIFDMSEGITPVYGTHSHSDRNHSHSEADADPHFWASVKNARHIAGNMLAALTALRPGAASYFAGRHTALTARLDSIDADASARMADIPSRAFLIWHPSLSYFARDYSLSQIALNAENKETSPQQLRGILAKAESEQPVAFIIPEGLDARQTEGITAQTSLSPVAINLMDADWEKSISDAVNAIADR